MKQTAVEWLVEQLIPKAMATYDTTTYNAIQQAKEMEKEQIGYTKEDVLKSGEMGEVNHHDTKHIVTYLDEAKHYNKTFNTNEK